MLKKLFIGILGLLSQFSILCQCDNNLIQNGNFEIDSIGQGAVGQYWTASEGSPDIDNALDELSFLNGTWDGEVLSSSDGGNWQNIAHITFSNGDKYVESIGQNIQFHKSIPYKLSFEFTSQSVLPSLPGNGHSAIDVLLNEKVIHTTHIDTSVFTWEEICFTFIPNQKDNFIKFIINDNLNTEINRTKYVAIDGVCIKPVEMGMFCEND